ncbi:hypothetical protein MPSEU_000676100 [Mayamaea pseudoterrestris]|nr:hypothetical protein MPSEU_000676100 [Mayamaea pseudoterrestris]
MSFPSPHSTALDATVATEPTGLRSSAGSNRIINMFRRTAPPRRQASNNTAVSNSATVRTTREGDYQPGPETSSALARRNMCALFWYYSIYPGDDRKTFLQHVLDNCIWRTLLIVLTFILLFGAQIRDIAIPPDGDAACDGIFMTTFVLLVIDMLMRIDCEPTYFVCRCGDNGHDGAERTWFNSIQVGSFLFWCDILSTMTLLTEISFINKSGFAAASITIYLDQFGIPSDGLDEVNQAVPVEADLVLLVAICKTARVARFIRSNTALTISSKVNWFALVNLLNPCWYLRAVIRAMVLVCDSCVSSRRKNRNDRQSSAMDDFSSNGLGKEDESRFRRSSWGALGLGALAAIREKNSTLADVQVGVKSWPIRAMRFIGLAPASDEQWRRHVAATKIQRLWRRYKGMDPDYLLESGTGWKPLGRASKTTDQALQKKSSIMHFSISRALPGRRGTTTASAAATKPLNRSGRKTVNRESQVGTAMRELTGQRVAIGIIIGLLLTVLFTYTEVDATRPATMIVLHNQTSYPAFANRSLEAAMSSSIPDLYTYVLANGQIKNFSISEMQAGERALRPRETLIVTIQGYDGSATTGKFALKDERQEEALVALLSTIFILVVWFFGVTAFAGPVMVLVVIPIERMVRLLGMLMVDPLGYENSPRYKNFMKEEDQITKNTRWTKEVLKGMETSFLMSTILRIGSLMKVGFGSAGVEIIRNNLEKGQNKNNLALNSQGSSVSCIFLFCDIRQFTDATVLARRGFRFYK